MTRRLSLKKDVLQELTTAELGSVAGGATEFSCLDYISCFPWQCVTRAVQTLICSD